MIKIRTKNKFSPIKQTVLFAVGGFLLLLTVFFVVLAIIFAVGGDAPSIFGSSVYLCEEGAFNLITPNSAVIASKVSPEKINKDHIILYKSLDERVCLAKVTDTRLADGVLTFLAVSDKNEDVTVSQGQVLGKVNSYSAFLGGLFTFLTSPIGLLLLAIVPCIIVFVLEIVKLYHIKHPDKEEVSIIRKQDEVPTFTPYVKNAVNAYKSSAEISNVDVPIKKEKPVPPLFLGPKSIKRESVSPPLSQRKLDEAIAETLREKEIRQIRAEKAATPPVKRTVPDEPLKKSEPAFTPMFSSKQVTPTMQQIAPTVQQVAPTVQQVAPTVQQVEKDAINIDRNKPTYDGKTVQNAFLERKTYQPANMNTKKIDLDNFGTTAKVKQMPVQTVKDSRQNVLNSKKEKSSDLPFSFLGGTTQSIDVSPPKPVRPSFWEDEATAKPYVPKKRPTKSKPTRLDELLNDEDDEDVRFDIDDILKSLENNGK